MLTLLALTLSAQTGGTDRAPKITNRTALDAAGFQVGMLPLVDPEGTGMMLLKVDGTGRLTSCALTDWSGTGKGDAAMEKHICAGLKAHAEFAPGRNAKGQLVGGSLTVPIDPQLVSEPDIANLAEVFSEDDYPYEAIEEGKEGDVLVRVAVGADGTSGPCTIRKSSGVASLDSISCKALRERGKFLPAHNAAGEAVAANWDAAIRWRLPEYTLFAERKSSTRLAFDVNGKLAACTHTIKMLPEDLVKINCEAMERVAITMFPRDQLMSRAIVFEEGFQIGGPETANAVGTGPGQRRITFSGYAVRVGADGKVISCAPLDPSFVPPEDGPCDQYKRSGFEPLEDSADLSDRFGVSYFAAYFDEHTR